jgi:acyl dehydratase
MSIAYAEDFKSGDVFDIGSYKVTAKEIAAFAKKYDPFPFHIDEEAAKKNHLWRYHFKRLVNRTNLA